MAKSTTLMKQEHRPFLEQVVGNEKGRVFDIFQERITLGRAEDNDIVISSEGISRAHAVIERNADGFYSVRDNQSKNGIQVNGNTVKESQLQDGDIVQIGTLTFRFHSGEVFEEVQQGSPNNELALDHQVYQIGSQKRRGISTTTIRRILIYGVLAGILAYAYTISNEPTPSEKKPGEIGAPDLNSSSNGPPKFESSPSTPKTPGIEDPTLKNAEQQMEKLDWNNASLKEAEQYFRKGQREYLSKNYHRAIEAFQTSLSLYRGHKLAYDYLRLSIYEAEAEAKQHWEIGVKYFESLQYSRAIYHFSEVTSLMAHKPSDPMVTESEKYIAICKRRMQAVELFP